MHPSKLPSFEHNEYVRRWLSNALPEEVADEQRKTAIEHDNTTKLEPEAPLEKSHHQKYSRYHKLQRQSKTQRDGHQHPPSSRPAPYQPMRGLSTLQKSSISNTDNGQAFVVREKELSGDRVAVHSPVMHPKRKHTDAANEKYEDPSLKYARRARRKTREDRYDYKGYEHAAKGQKINGHNKRRARRKSGMVLNAEFQAPNVDSERLTLKQSIGPGFLSKGISSHPSPRRGVPDLTFPEMAFLSRKRDIEKTRVQAALRSTKGKRAREAAQDISEYFSQPVDKMQNRKSSYALYQGIPDQKHREYGHTFAPKAHGQTCSELSASLLLSAAGPVFRATSPARTWQADPHDPRTQHYEPRVGQMESKLDEDLRISWSPSLAHSLNEKQRNFRMAQRDRLLRSEETVHPRSSISNVPTGLLQPFHSREPRVNFSNQETEAPSRTLRHLYSLEDLKDLADKLAPPNETLLVHETVVAATPRPSMPHIRHLTTVATTLPSELPTASGGCVLSETRKFGNAQHQRSSESSPRHPYGDGLQRDGLQTDIEARYGSPSEIAHDRPLEHGEETAFDNYVELAATGPQRGERYSSANIEEQFQGKLREHFNTFEKYEHDPSTDRMDGFDTELLESISAPRAKLDYDLDALPFVSHEDGAQTAAMLAEEPTTTALPFVERVIDPCATHILDHRIPGSDVTVHRPALLRPSEEELRESPFTGYSRPWILY